MAPAPLSSSRRVLVCPPEADNLSLDIKGKSEATQTDFGPNFVPLDHDSMDSVESRLSATDSALGDSEASDSDFSENNSFISRISRGIGGFFSQNRHDRGTQTVKDSLTSETEKLAFDIVFFVLGKRGNKAKDETTQVLRKSVTKMLDKHSLVFNSMVSRLHVTRDSDLHNGFNDLSNELFQHNEVSWAKIIALFAFGARLAQFCEESNLNSLVFDVANDLSQYAVEKLTPFLRQNGGWNTLCEAFPPERDYETDIRNSLMVAGAGFATMTALFLTLRH